MYVFYLVDALPDSIFVFVKIFHALDGEYSTQDVVAILENQVCGFNRIEFGLEIMHNNSVHVDHLVDIDVGTKQSFLFDAIECGIHITRKFVGVRRK